jgi:hypothetical protein
VFEQPADGELDYATGHCFAPQQQLEYISVGVDVAVATIPKPRNKLLYLRGVFLEFKKLSDLKTVFELNFCLLPLAELTRISIRLATKAARFDSNQHKARFDFKFEFSTTLCSDSQQASVNDYLKQLILFDQIFILLLHKGTLHKPGFDNDAVVAH